MSILKIENFDTIKVTGRIQPKYLVGVTGTVVGQNEKGVWVLLNKNHPNLIGRKHSTTGTLGFPFATVQRVDCPTKEDSAKAAQIQELVRLGIMETIERGDTLCNG